MEDLETFLEDIATNGVKPYARGYVSKEIQKAKPEIDELIKKAKERGFDADATRIEKTVQKYSIMGSFKLQKGSSFTLPTHGRLGRFAGYLLAAGITVLFAYIGYEIYRYSEYLAQDIISSYNKELKLKVINKRLPRVARILK